MARKSFYVQNKRLRNFQCEFRGFKNESSHNVSSIPDAIVGGFEIKGLSSGQLKRLALALSLISDPGLLLLDEPTSKIDSAAAFNIVKTLKQLTDKGNDVTNILF